MHEPELTPASVRGFTDLVRNPIDWEPGLYCIIGEAVYQVEDQDEMDTLVAYCKKPKEWRAAWS